MTGDLLARDLVRHPELGCGRVEKVTGFGEGQNCLVYFGRTGTESWYKRSVLEKLPEEALASYELLQLAVRELREEESPEIALGERWKGGELILKPGEDGLAPKAIPMENFFHKVVMIRDRLRVLEQQINAHKGLDDADKVGLQQYVTRIYGTLTTFNVLFRDKKDHFVGQKGQK